MYAAEIFERIEAGKGSSKRFQPYLLSVSTPLAHQRGLALSELLSLDNAARRFVSMFGGTFQDALTSVTMTCLHNIGAACAYWIERGVWVNSDN